MDGVHAMALCQRVFEVPENGKNALNGNFSNLRINICFQRNLNEPIIYLESWVDRNKKICHQILHVTSSSGGISSMKIEFFSSKAEKHANIQTFQRIQT